MQVINCKRGDTFSLTCFWYGNDPEFSPKPLTDFQIQSWISQGENYVEMIYEPVSEEGGVFRLYLDAQSINNLLPGRWYSDIEFRKDDVISSSETFEVIVQKDYTNANQN